MIIMAATDTPLCSDCLPICIPYLLTAAQSHDNTRCLAVLPPIPPNTFFANTWKRNMDSQSLHLHSIREQQQPSNQRTPYLNSCGTVTPYRTSIISDFDCMRTCPGRGTGRHRMNELVPQHFWACRSLKMERAQAQVA
uniref:Uncharacterized protein n=1 Tax=Eutreptiella gymnastica TaxID=73025 RepID=A0A7S4LBA9_9EUGL|mmetsp:Transcript_83778/g.139758  ORF Transcript_83778/g.139758 Transcript_83778/m.139758 type:complete len:138 (+) Transcript_83778:831-1244(+)